jgi:hypothetical protein
MKTKITYLLLILPLMTFAQGPWEFNTSGNTEGFTCNSSAGTFGAHTVTQSGGDLSVVFVAKAGNNPIIKNATAGINADTKVNFIEIRLKNLSTVTFLRLSPAGNTTTYADYVIPAQTTSYNTYVFDVTEWTGNPVGIDIKCMSWDKTDKNGVFIPGSSAYTPVAGESILIDYIRPLDSYATPEVNTFNFTATNEGFNKLTRATAVWATESGKGTLQVKSTVASALFTVVALNTVIAHVEGANKYAHVKLKNSTTTNTEFQLKGKVAAVATPFSPVQTFTASDTDYKTYDFDLSTWDSGYQFPELNFGVKDNWSATLLYVAGDIVIVSNTYYKSLTGVNAADAAALKLDTTNWAICDSTGAIAPAVGAVVGGALDITNSIYIDSIVFDNTNLGTNDVELANNTIAFYPNPAQEVLNVNSANPIAKIEVYDLLGKKVASNNNAKNVNVAALGKGVYIVKVVQENGSVVAKQFIKQ